MRFGQDAGRRLLRPAVGRDQSRVMRGHCRRRERECRRQRTIDAARLAQVRLRDRACERLPLPPEPTPPAMLFALVVCRSGARGRGERRRRERSPPAGEGLQRGDEAGAVEMLHERDDITAQFATATIPHLLFDVDGETVGAAAHRARPAAIDPTAQPDAAPLDLALEGTARDCAIKSAKWMGALMGASSAAPAWCAGEAALRSENRIQIPRHASMTISPTVPPSAASETRRGPPRRTRFSCRT